jgi:hypothetical protein
MHADLIQRIYWLRYKGDSQPYEKVMNYLHGLPSNQQQSFIVNSQQYFWNTFNSSLFEDFILEGKDWFYLHSAENEFESVSYVYHWHENLLGQKDYPLISTMWLLKSSFPGLETTDDKPICIWLPERVKSPYHRMQSEWRRIIEKLMDKQVPIKGTVGYRIDSEEDKRIR